MAVQEKKNLKKEAEDQLLQVAIPGSGVVTKSTTEEDGGDSE
jgi:hypothetical protein